MAINQYISPEGKDLWSVYVNLRSKKVPSLRAQRRVLGIKTRSEAEREEVRLIRECEREIFEKEKLGSSYGFVIEAWERHLIEERGTTLNEHTRDDYISALMKHTAEWWKRPAASITRADVKTVLMQMKAQGASLSYQNKMKVIINRVFTFGIEYGLIHEMERSPAYGLSLGRVEEKKPEILTIAEIRHLLEEARVLQHPWYEIWAMALLTGMRNGELYALTWSDVDWENKLISVNKSFNRRRGATKSTKSGEYRSVPISGELLGLLKELKTKAGQSPFVLPRIQNWTKGQQARELRKFCIGIGLPPVRFHTLRACFATQLIRNGVPPIQIQKVCGWKDLDTMQRYIRMAGIEITGVTESLRVLPETDVMARVVNLFTKKLV